MLACFHYHSSLVCVVYLSSSLPLCSSLLSWLPCIPHTTTKCAKKFEFQFPPAWYTIYQVNVWAGPPRMW